MMLRTHLESTSVRVADGSAPNSVPMPKAMPVLANKTRAILFRLNHKTLWKAISEFSIDARAISLQPRQKIATRCVPTGYKFPNLNKRASTMWLSKLPGALVLRAIFV